LATMGTGVSISLEPHEGASIIEVMGNHVSVQSSWGTMVNLPSLQYGQNLDLVVKMNIPPSLLSKDTPFITATFKFKHWKFGETVSAVEGCVSEPDAPEVHVQRRRLKFVESLARIVSSPAPAQTQIVQDLIDDFKSGTDPKEKGLFEDVSGQVREAIMPEYYVKWGKHYLPSLGRAHQLQQSNNFKDPGIQFYGGELFNQLRDEVDAIFSKLPPPEPTKAVRAPGGGPAPAFSMAQYNTASGGCFAASCLVSMADHTQKRVCDIKKGDLVSTLNNRQAEVLCVMKIRCYQSYTDLVELEGGLLITPYHPIKMGGKWRFPCDVGQPSLRYSPFVYNFVLKENGAEDHVMIINDVACVTLAHNYKEDVVRHSYFGSRKVLEDLRELSGWESGLVEVDDDCFVRDTLTGLICKISPSGNEVVKTLYTQENATVCVSVY